MLITSCRNPDWLKGKSGPGVLKNRTVSMVLLQGVNSGKNPPGVENGEGNWEATGKKLAPSARGLGVSRHTTKKKGNCIGPTFPVPFMQRKVSPKS